MSNEKLVLTQTFVRELFRCVGLPTSSSRVESLSQLLCGTRSVQNASEEFFRSIFGTLFERTILNRSNSLEQVSGNINLPLNIIPTVLVREFIRYLPMNELKRMNNNEHHRSISREGRRRYIDIIQKFITNVPIFNVMLIITRSFLSGSAVLSFFNPIYGFMKPPVGDLDIYCLPQYRDILIMFLVMLEDYNIKTEYNRELRYSRSNNAGIRSVVKLAKDDLHIDLVVSNSVMTAAYPIPFFFSTHVMNLLTPLHAYSFYPEYTFNGKGLLTANAFYLFYNFRRYDVPVLRSRVYSAVKKYQERGFYLAISPTAFDERHHEHCNTDTCRLYRTTDGPDIFHFNYATNVDVGFVLGSRHLNGLFNGVNLGWTIGGQRCNVDGLDTMMQVSFVNIHV